MNPKQPGQQPSYDTYLDQIAPQPVKRSVVQSLKPIHMILGGVVLILIILLVVSLISSSAGAPKRTIEQLAARLQTTKKIADDATTVLKSSELRTLNSNLKIYLTNTNRDFTAPLATLGINTDKLASSATASESATDMIARLEDARLNGVYDRTYAREMTYQLDTTLTLMRQAFNSTKSVSIQTVLAGAYDNLTPIKEKFSEFNSSQSN